MQRLHGWKKEKQTSFSAMATRVALATILVCMGLAFYLCLRHPYQRPTLHVVVLTPLAQNSSENRVPDRSSSVTRTVRLEPAGDLATCLCSASGRLIEQTVQPYLPPARITPSGRQLTERAKCLTNILGQLKYQPATFVVYLSGVLSLENKQPALCDHSHTALHGGEDLLILPLIDALQEVTDQQILLCIDLVTPSPSSPANIVAPLIAEELTELIEQRLTKQSRGAPLAVCIQLSSADSPTSPNMSSTPLASALSEALRTELNSGTFQASRLKERLTPHSHHQQLTHAAELLWLTNLHWPVVTAPIRLPTKLPQHVPLQVAHEQAHEQQPLSNMPLTPDTVSSHLQGDTDTLNPQQLLTISRHAIERFDLFPGDKVWATVPDWLPLPQPLSYRQRHPGVVARLERCLKHWETAERLTGNDLNRSGLQALARELSALAAASPMSIELPNGELPHNEMSSQRSPGALRFHVTESALVNLALAQIGALDSQAVAESLQLVQQLTLVIDHCDNPAQCQAAIVSFQSQWPTITVELDSSLKLCQASLPWPTLQRALRLQLVALRARVGLFQDTAETQTHFRPAEQLYQRVQAEIDLRPDSHSDAELDILLDRCLGHFHAAIHTMEKSTAAHLQHHALVSEFIYRPRWASISGISTNSTKETLQAFKEAWQRIYPDSLGSNAQVATRSINSERAAGITRLLDETEQLLAQATTTKDERSTTLRKLSQAAIAVMECDSQSTPSDPFVGSPILPAWYHPHWQRLIESNMRACTNLLHGATVDQQSQQARLASIWKRLAAESKQQGLAIEPDPSDANMLSVDAPQLIQLDSTKSTPLTFAITYAALMPNVPQLTANYDEDSIAISLGDQAMRPGRAIELPRPSKVGAGVAQRDRNESQLVLSVQTRDGRSNREPLVLLVSQGHMQRRAVIHLQAPASAMVDIQLTDENLVRSAGQGSGAPSDCLLLPNRQQALRLQLTHRAQSKLQLSVQVWGTAGSTEAISAQLPSGTVDQAAAAQWLMTQPSLVPLAQNAQVDLDVTDQQTVTLLPAGNLPDLKQSACRCSGLLIGVTDLHTKRTQFAYRALRLRYPTDYVHQQMTVDHEYGRIELINRLQSDSQPVSAIVMHRLLEWPLATTVAQATLQLTSALPSGNVLLSSSRTRADRLVLLTEIDGWPGISAALIDRHQGSIIAQPVAAIELNTGLTDGVLPASSDNISVEVNAWSSLSPVNGQVDLHIGWDRNLDRTLIGEPTDHTQRLQKAQAFYRGLDERGALIFESRIEPLSFSFSTAGLSNQRASLLATLSCEGTLLARASQTVVIDQQPPVVKGALVASGNQAVHGAPLAVQIGADDYGLSGIARVEAAWSLDGRLRLADDMQPLPGVLRPDGSWQVTIPTATVPLGDNTLLVRAVDRSGNVSDTYSCKVTLHSQAELDAIASRRTCTVSGSLLFVKQPQSGLLVELIQSVPNEKSAALQSDVREEQLPVDAQSVVASTISQADGSFRLTEIPSGQYILRVGGVVRGMRVAQTRGLTIDASKQPSAIEWRLDKQP